LLAFLSLITAVPDVVLGPLLAVATHDPVSGTVNVYVVPECDVGCSVMLPFFKIHDVVPDGHTAMTVAVNGP